MNKTKAREKVLKQLKGWEIARLNSEIDSSIQNITQNYFVEGRYSERGVYGETYALFSFLETKLLRVALDGGESAAFRKTLFDCCNAYYLDARLSKLVVNFDQGRNDYIRLERQHLIQIVLHHILGLKDRARWLFDDLARYRDGIAPEHQQTETELMVLFENLLNIHSNIRQFVGEQRRHSGFYEPFFHVLSKGDESDISEFLRLHCEAAAACYLDGDSDCLTLFGEVIMSAFPLDLAAILKSYSEELFFAVKPFDGLYGYLMDLRLEDELKIDEFFEECEAFVRKLENERGLISASL